MSYSITQRKPGVIPYPKGRPRKEISDEMSSLRHPYNFSSNFGARNVSNGARGVENGAAAAVIYSRVVL